NHLSPPCVRFLHQVSEQAQLRQLADFCSQLNAESSVGGKERLLRQHPEWFGILKQVYDTSTTFGLTSTAVKRYPLQEPQDIVKPGHTQPFGLSGILNHLATRSLVGNKASAAFKSYVLRECNGHPELEQFCYRILDRHLKAGVSRGLLRRVYPEAFRTFHVALAKDFIKGRSEAQLQSGAWYASEKMDGVRCLTVVKRGDPMQITFYSRTGRPFLTLRHLHDHLLAMMPSLPHPYEDGFVLDGELLAAPLGQHSFTETMQQIRRLTDMPTPHYYVFDIVPFADFVQGHSALRLTERWKTLELFAPTISSGAVLQVVPQRLMRNMDDVTQMEKKALEAGWEGIILRRDVPYVGKRTTDLLKLKQWKDDEYKVIDTEVGHMRLPSGKEQDLLLAVTVLHKGHPVSIGSGFSLEQRERYARDPNLILGKEITVRYFEESKSKGKASLRFPSVKMVYEEGVRNV
ncbi:hypothetical protein BZG36_00760, partial [Bifiguratus adelaidae]